MAQNTAGGPFGGLVNSPELWDKLLQSFGSIGRYLATPPGPSLGANALHDVAQIGATAPLGLPGALGLTAAGEGMRPPQEQSFVQQPLQGMKSALGLSQLALQDPMMLQKLATSALLGAPGAIKQALFEHPVALPLMAMPFLPGMGRFNEENNPEALKFGQSVLENAARRIADREKRVQRKLTQHEVEDVIQQAMAEVQPSTKPYPLSGLQKMSDARLMDWYDNWKYKTYISGLRDSPTAHARMKSHLTDIEAELKQRGLDPNAPSSQNAQLSREELLHQFEEGSAGPLPNIPVQRQSGLLDQIGKEMNFGRSDYSGLSKDELASRQSEYAGDIQRVIDKGGLPAGIYAFRLLEYMDEAQRRGLPIQDKLPSELLHRIINERRKVEGAAPLPDMGLPQQKGADLLKQVNLPEHPQYSKEQDVVSGLNDPDFRRGNYRISQKEYWESGQRYIRGTKGWMADPNQRVGDIQQVDNQTILPRPSSQLGAYLDRTVWKRYFPQGDPNATREEKIGNFLTGAGGPSRAYIDEALHELTDISGNARVAQFWLMQHIMQRKLAGMATPAEVVWFELQKGMPGINPTGVPKEHGIIVERHARPTEISQLDQMYPNAIPGKIYKFGTHAARYNGRHTYGANNEVKSSWTWRRDPFYHFDEHGKPFTEPPDEGMAGSTR